MILLDTSSWCIFIIHLTWNLLVFTPGWGSRALSLFRPIRHWNFGSQVSNIEMSIHDIILRSGGLSFPDCSFSEFWLSEMKCHVFSRLQHSSLAQFREKENGAIHPNGHSFKNCVLNRIEFSKISFRIGCFTTHWTTHWIQGRGRELRGSEHEWDWAAKS